MAASPRPQLDFHAFIAFYPVQDLSATRDFYGRDVGLEVARDQGACLIFRVAGGGFLGFCALPPGERPPRHDGVILTLVCDEVDAVYQRLRRLNAELEAPPRENPRFGIYHFFARDPDGYRLEVQRFGEPLH